MDNCLFQVFATLVMSVRLLFLPAAIILLIMKRWEMAIIFFVIWIIAFFVAKSLRRK